MDNYRTILVGVDLSPESSQVLERAAKLALQNHSRLHLVHVIEPLTFAYGGDIPMDLSEVQEQLQQQAQQQLGKLAERFSVEPACQHLEIGQPAAELHRLAGELSAELIVVGSHGRHGLALLLGSTSSGVLHGARCDMLAVRVDES